MPEREVHYCTTEDGVRIAYSIFGRGPPLLVKPFCFESFSLDSVVPEHQVFMKKLGAGRSLIQFDHRGTGLSDRQPPSVDTAALMADMEAVISAVGQPVSLWCSTLTRSALVLAATRPSLLKRLVIYGTAAHEPTAGAHPQLMAGFVEMARGNWDLAVQTFADMCGRREFPEAAVRIASWFHDSSSPEHVTAMFRATGEDIRPLLSKISVPTLILHRVQDPSVAFEHARSLASAIPNARLVPLPGPGHAFFLGETGPVLAAVKAFLDEEAETRALPVSEEEQLRPPFRAVLFTDLVGHTAIISRLGDARGRDLLREHERITRERLRKHGGTEVKSMGDGFMASFASVTGAVECAIALQQAFSAWNESEPAQALAPLQVRVGVNAGEPIEEEGDLFGASVIMASRIAARAEAGEILVADTVRGLCAGKGFLFSDRGEFLAKGFEEPVRLFEVRWKESAE
jgi:class 3 adenylate cyclase/pimeloyl-ACP methyl ester carboxylesterase